MNYEKQGSLSAYLRCLLATGRNVFTAAEATHALQISHGAFLDAAERLQRRHLLISPRRGFYVVVEPQFAVWQAPSPDWYIDALMRHEGAPYYVALLQAAASHGASHQAVMEFQVISSKRLPTILAGRSRVAFYYRKNLTLIQSGVVPRKTYTGYLQISSPALTALDLLRYPHASGGLDNVATVLTEMAPGIKAKDLGSLSSHFEAPVVQRLGYLLEFLGHGRIAESMARALRAKRNRRQIELEPVATAMPDLIPPVLERNARWQVSVRRYPDPDV
jgi:predicted transcriptional regulator of viral defense system